MNFTGFPAEGLRFLRELADNNEPAWFKPRRDDYEAQVRGPMLSLVADLLTLAAARNLPLTGEPAKAIFRIYRDVRFAKDKRPYKTHCGASLSRTGAKLAPGLFYIHIEPGGCFAAAGFWHPEPPLLGRLRQRILAEPGRFLKVVHALAAKGMPIGSDEEDSHRGVPETPQPDRAAGADRRRNPQRHVADAAARSVHGGAAAAGFWMGRGRRLIPGDACVDRSARLADADWI